MFVRKKHHGIRVKDLETIIGKSVSISGDVKLGSGIRIDGRLEGNISQEDGHHCATVAIAEGAKVEGEIHAGHVIVSGDVIGNIHADRIEILHSAHIQGDLTYSSIRIENGAKIFGLLNQTGDRKPEGRPVSLLRTEEKKSA